MVDVVVGLAVGVSVWVMSGEGGRALVGSPELMAGMLVMLGVNVGDVEVVDVVEVLWSLLSEADG